MRDEAEGSYTGARGIKFWLHPGSWAKKPGTLDRGGGAGRDDAPLRAQRRGDRAALARGARRPPAQAQLQRSALGEGPRRRWWRSSAARCTACPCTPTGACPTAPIDPDAAREIFIREALVEGELETRAPFLAHNRRLVAEIERLEHKSRRQDVLVDDELIYAFYDERMPGEVIYNAPTSSSWRRASRSGEADACCYLSREDLMRHEAAGITTDNFPPTLELGPNRFALEYHFEPGSPRDGVTMTVPLALLNQVPAARTEWLVPGLLKEKVRALAKSMPQRLRHKLGALDDFAAAFSAAVPPVGHCRWPTPCAAMCAASSTSTSRSMPSARTRRRRTCT